MKNLIVIIVVHSFILGFTNLNASTVTAQQERFKPWINELKKPLEVSTDPVVVADELLNAGVRVATFNIQALSKIYSAEDKAFQQMRSDVKKLEDAIGEFDKWKKILEKSKKNKKLEKNVEKAKASLAELLKKQNWIGKKNKLSEFENFLEGFDWKSYSKDKAEVLSLVVQHLQNIQSTSFDMSILEHGDGLHELRRELRWFLIQARVLNGLITYDKKSNQCDLVEFKGIENTSIATSKYSQLPLSKSEISPCFISRCAYLGVAQLVEDLGEIKDEAETINNESGEETTDEVPAELKTRAQEQYDLMVNSNVLSQIESEIKACY